MPSADRQSLGTAPAPANPTLALPPAAAIDACSSRLGGEIVNYDSVQIYRGFDIGSAKPSPEERARVPHHLFDIVDADEEFNAADYGRVAREVVRRRMRQTPILVGGTFFYLRALLSGLPEMPGRDEALRARIRRIAGRPRGAARLHRWLSKIDPRSGRKIAPADRHRVERALEVWITSGRPISSWERERGKRAAVDQDRPAHRPRRARADPRRPRGDDVPRRTR